MPWLMEKDVHFCSKSRRWVVNMAFAHHKKQNTLRPSKRTNFLDYGGQNRCFCSQTEELLAFDDVYHNQQMLVDRITSRLTQIKRHAPLYQEKDFAFTQVTQTDYTNQISWTIIVIFTSLNLVQSNLYNKKSVLRGGTYSLTSFFPQVW